MKFNKIELSFYLLILGILIYPLYFTSFGMNMINRNFIEILYFFLGFIILINNISKNTVSYYVYLLVLFSVFLEYIFNSNLIHNYSPMSIVSLVGGLSGNYGIVFYSLISIVFLLNKKNTQLLFSMNLNKIIKILYVYFFVYSIIALMSYFSNYGSLIAKNSVNGHTYHMTGIAILIYLFLFIKNKYIDEKYKFLFFYNFVIVVLIFKTRGVLLIDLFLFLFSFKHISLYIIKIVKTIPGYKISAILGFVIILVLIFGTTQLTNTHSSEASLEIFAKEGAGKRDIAILQWIVYITEVYMESSIIDIPEYTPHSTYPGMVGYIGILYSTLFIIFLISLFYNIFKNQFSTELILLTSTLGILFSVSFISPLSYFYFIFILIIINNIGTKINIKYKKGLNQNATIK